MSVLSKSELIKSIQEERLKAANIFEAFIENWEGVIHRFSESKCITLGEAADKYSASFYFYCEYIQELDDALKKIDPKKNADPFMEIRSEA